MVAIGNRRVRLKAEPAAQQPIADARGQELVHFVPAGAGEHEESKSIRTIAAGRESLKIPGLTQGAPVAAEKRQPITAPRGETSRQELPVLAPCIPCPARHRQIADPQPRFTV